MLTQIILFTTAFIIVNGGVNIYVDKGNPYTDGPLDVGELTLSETIDNSPKHSKVYFPLEPGNYSTIYFVGGFNSIVLAEYYTIALKKIAKHGFFVFGVDYDFPVEENYDEKQRAFGQDINIYFEQLEFFKKYVKTVSTPRYDNMGLLCHSSGCDVTLRMIEDNRIRFNATAFLEPYSILIRNQPNINDIPAFMYGTQLSEEGVVRCNVPGYDYLQFYNMWKCPKVALEVANFGHCDILDPVPWNVCRVTHFCKIATNVTTAALDHYRQVVQGTISSFFMTMLQGRSDAITYISDVQKVPIKLLENKSDLTCKWSLQSKGPSY